MCAMRLAVVIGHTSASGGAIRRDTGESEYKWNSRLAAMMVVLQSSYSLQVKVFRRKSGVSYYQQIKRVYEAVDRWKADASIELHFNSSANPKATGTEMLSSGSTRSLALAAAVQGRMVDALGLADRGIKIRGRNERGGRSLHMGRAPAIIGEPFFGSNHKGLIASDEAGEMEAIAQAYLAGSKTALRAWADAESLAA